MAATLSRAISLLATFAVLLAAVFGVANGLQMRNGAYVAGQDLESLEHHAAAAHQEHMLVKRDTVHLKPNHWQLFFFGPANTTVPDHFVFFLDRRAKLLITDAFCRGDRFAVLDNNVCLGRTSIPPPPDNCTTYTLDPRRAFRDPNWSSASFELGKGWHNISIKVLTSPYCAGGAFIQLLIPSKACRIRSLGLAVLNDVRVPFKKADAACRAAGFDGLADINFANYQASSVLQRLCIGPFSNTWVRSWNTDTYGGGCLTQRIECVVPGSNINLAPDCDSLFSPICNDPKSSDANPDLGSKVISCIPGSGGPPIFSTTGGEGEGDGGVEVPPPQTTPPTTPTIL